MQSDDNDKRQSAQCEVVIESDCDNAGKTGRESSPDVDDEIVFVPNNPKTWSEKNIDTWIKWATKKFSLSPSIDASRIPRNADELAKFNKAEFYIACGSFEGGKMLSQHYKYMMEVAHESYDESLQSDCDPG